MSRIRIIGLALVAVFAMSAVAASAASAATEGPFYKVAGKRLAATETKPLKAKASKNFVLTASGVVITCTKLKLSSASKIIGSTGKNPGTSEETLEFEGCTVTGNGEGCEVENGKITTNVVTNTLGYATKERTGKILVPRLSSFHPAADTVNIEGNWGSLICV
jgi:Flp pilus assembly protein TadG